MSHDQSGALFAAIQRIIPQHLLSRWLGRLAEAQTPWLKSALIRAFIARYGVDMSEAERTEIHSYVHFNDFFTRALKPGARAIDATPNGIVCPADGIVSQLGAIDGHRLIQAKNHQFRLAALLAGDDVCAPFINGSFATIYLAPRDYHRVHMPLDGRLLWTRYIPGRLFSVNQATTRHVPGLFARNERLVCLFETRSGPMAVVLVGAMVVAGIETTWQRTYPPATATGQDFNDRGPTLAKGEELGRFKLGSTVVVLLPPGTTWDQQLGAESRVRIGQKLGQTDHYRA